MNDRFDAPGESFDPLIAAARRLATEQHPERDLWPGIAAGIANPAPASGGRSARYFAQAAAVALLVGASSGITWLVMKDAAAPVAVTAPELVVEQASYVGRYSLGPDFEYARSNLMSALDKRLETLSPESRQEVERNLAVIRSAIAEINAELVQQPDNVLLQELLMKTYHEELNVMRNVRGLTQDVTRRNDI